MVAQFTLHGMWRSGPTYKVALMLAFCGAKWDYVHVDMAAGAHKKPEFLKLNRFGQVPCLVDHDMDVSLVQSAAILEHLALTFNKFRGSDREKRLIVKEWIYWDFDRLAPAIYRQRAMRIGLRNYTQDIMSMYYAEGLMALDVLEQALKGKQWLVGRSPTIADIDAYGVMYYAPAAGYDLAKYPGIVGWMKRFEALPGYASAENIMPKASRVS